MGIAGVGANTYNYYGMQYPKNYSTEQYGTTNTTSMASSNLTLHGDSDKYGKVLGGMGFPDGSNTSVYKSKNYTADHPVFLVMTWDADGNKTETEIDASKVDPANASLQEMMTLNANRHLNGEQSFENELMMSAGRLYGDETSFGYEDFFTKNNWISEMEDSMNMQYMLGNMDGYLRYKRASEIFQSISDTIMNIGDSSNRIDDKAVYSKVLEQYGEQIKEKIKNGEIEPAYQIGGQSFTEEEWKKLAEKIDKAIEQIQTEPKESKKTEKNQMEINKTDDALTEEQKYKLFTDANERAFYSYGPNAPEEVKKAWMDAAEKTGANGAGMAANGMITHITAMLAERAVRWINGDVGYTDILGDSVDSAIAAAEKALYDLENPLQPISTRTPEVQKQIEKEKQFYEQFLANLNSNIFLND